MAPGPPFSDLKTIADSRKDNGHAIRQVCDRFVAHRRTMGLFTEASVAIDGGKFKAVNNRDENFARAKDGAVLGADRRERRPLSAPARQR